MLKINHLTSKVNDVVLIDDLSLSVNKGDVIAVIGPSGSGKSAFVQSLNHMITPESGEIIFDGKNIIDPSAFGPDTRMKMGMVFQEYNIFPHMTLIENAMFAPVRKKGLSKQEAYENGMKCLRKVGLGGKALSYASELSSGERQRAEIARTLAMEPDIIIFDDPTSSLDPIMEREVEAVIMDLAKDGTTMIVATNSLRLAKSVATRVLVFSKGKIYDEGSPKEIFDNPKKIFTREFIGGLKSLEIEIDSKDHDHIRFVNEIDVFALFYRLSSKMTNHVLSIFEETGIILLERLSEPRIYYRFESINEEELHISISYNGDVFNLNDSDEFVSMSIINSAGEFLGHEVLDDPIYKNKVVYRVK